MALLGRHLAGETAPVLLFAGEPGIGKSRRMAEAAQRSADAGGCVIASGLHTPQRSGHDKPLVSALAQDVRRTPSARLRLDLFKV